MVRRGGCTWGISYPDPLEPTDYFVQIFPEEFMGYSRPGHDKLTACLARLSKSVLSVKNQTIVVSRRVERDGAASLTGFRPKEKQSSYQSISLASHLVGVQFEM